MQLVTLLFEKKIKPDFSQVKKRVAELLGEEVDSSSEREFSSSYILFYKERLIEYQDTFAPAQTAFMIPDDGSEVEGYEDCIQQSWSFPEASDVVSKATFSILVSEFMSRALEPKERLQLFHAALQAAVEICQPIGLVFHHSSQVVCPQAYLESCQNPPELRLGAINIRFYNISNSDGDMIMDSRGLEEIGLPDLQCHFHHLEPDDVARVLFNTAVYIVDKGDVIESGQTIAGINQGDMWLCQFEDSLLEPKRQLIDVNPGADYAAGQRSTE